MTDNKEVSPKAEDGTTEVKKARKPRGPNKKKETKQNEEPIEQSASSTVPEIGLQGEEADQEESIEEVKQEEVILPPATKSTDILKKRKKQRRAKLSDLARWRGRLK